VRVAECVVAYVAEETSADSRLLTGRDQADLLTIANFENTFLRLLICLI
jgi:hypothetical protein